MNRLGELLNVLEKSSKDIDCSKCPAFSFCEAKLDAATKQITCIDILFEWLMEEPVDVNSK